MPSRNKNPIKLTATNIMLYESVDNYHPNPNGLEDSSVRMINHEDLNDFSSQSIVCAMDRFVKAVNNMNETIMVPCRLLDIDVGSKKTTNKVPKLMKGGADPYSYYTILNSVKNDIIWGASSNEDDNTNDSPCLTPSINNTRWTGQETNSSPNKKVPLRRTSTVSLMSVYSSASEVDSEVASDSNEEDYACTESEEGNGTVAANSVTETLRTHLIGLHSCLKNLTDTATYITDCYQEVVNI